ESDDVGVDVGGHDRAGKDEKALRHLVDVADGAVGDDAETAERLMDVGLHLAPEGADAAVGRVDVLDHGNAGPGPALDIFVIGDAGGARIAGRVGLARADGRGPGIADYRVMVRERTDERLPVESGSATAGRDQLEGIADGGGVDRAEAIRQFG